MAVITQEPRGKTVKSWRAGDAGEPPFPDDYHVVRRAVLQVADLKSNHNKFYALELHAPAPEMPAPRCRLFTHYGRTDDLQNNPDGGQKECRYYPSLAHAEAGFDAIYRQKTAASKGYREVCLAAASVGSAKARGTSAGEIDDRTLRRIERPTPPLHPALRDLVRHLFEEATGTLTRTVAATITARGIETPLGVLTLGQVEKGEAILAEMFAVFQDPTASRRRATLEQLSGAFYTTIPHRIGRTRAAADAAVIDTPEAFAARQETLQLMKDMLHVNGGEGDGRAAGGVLFDAQADAQYRSLGCDLRPLDPADEQYLQVAGHVRAGVGSSGLKVRAVHAVRRPGEAERFAGRAAALSDHRLLFHGSRAANWVGILSRGIVLPRLAVSMGVRRTDAGWLGHGIYFADAARVSAGYAATGRRKTSFLAVARVALGRRKEYTKITNGLTAPPPGYDSSHGVRSRALRPSNFGDDEYVIYDPHQHRLEYLVEAAA